MAAEAPRSRVIKGLTADQRREARRQALLDAALDLFARHGYAATTIESLCQHAFVATKSFYEVFDSREACYRELLTQVADAGFALALRAWEETEQTEEAVSQVLITSLARIFCQDVRVARVTFGEGSAVTPLVERQRRENRRQIAAMIESIWSQYDVPGADHCLAIGVVGGLLDIIADWTLDTELDQSEEERVKAFEHLTASLDTFYRAVRAGMGS